MCTSPYYRVLCLSRSSRPVVSRLRSSPRWPFSVPGAVCLWEWSILSINWLHSTSISYGSETRRRRYSDWRPCGLWLAVRYLLNCDNSTCQYASRLIRWSCFVSSCCTTTGKYLCSWITSPVVLLSTIFLLCRPWYSLLVPLKMLLNIWKLTVLGAIALLYIFTLIKAVRNTGTLRWHHAGLNRRSLCPQDLVFFNYELLAGSSESLRATLF